MSIKLALFGTSSFGLLSFEKLRTDNRFNVVAVVTQPPKPTGRHQTLNDSAVASWAKEMTIPVLTPRTLKSATVIEQLRNLHADLFIVASYGLILPQTALDLPSSGCLNIHASLLPKYRGASPITAAIMNNDTVTGITFMNMDAGCDTGPILYQVPVNILAHDTRLLLEERLSIEAGESICATVHDWISGKLKPLFQPAIGSTSAPRLTRMDGRAVWDNAERLERQIRAYQPWPGLWTTWKKSEIKLLSATVINQPAAGPVGTIIKLPQGWGIVCQQGILCPKQIQFSGKKPQAAATIPGSYPDFTNGQLV